MTKSELVARVAIIYPYMNIKNVEKVISIILNVITEKLTEDGRVELRDFGSFSTKLRKAMYGRNPKSGEQVLIQEKRVPYFKAGKKLRDSLNEEIQI